MKLLETYFTPSGSHTVIKSKHEECWAITPSGVFMYLWGAANWINYTKVTKQWN